MNWIYLHIKPGSNENTLDKSSESFVIIDTFNIILLYHHREELNTVDKKISKRGRILICFKMETFGCKNFEYFQKRNVFSQIQNVIWIFFVLTRIKDNLSKQNKILSDLLFTTTFSWKDKINKKINLNVNVQY